MVIVVEAVVVIVAGATDVVEEEEIRRDFSSNPLVALVQLLLTLLVFSLLFPACATESVAVGLAWG